MAIRAIEGALVTTISRIGGLKARQRLLLKGFLGFLEGDVEAARPHPGVGVAGQEGRRSGGREGG